MKSRGFLLFIYFLLFFRAFAPLHFDRDVCSYIFLLGNLFLVCVLALVLSTRLGRECFPEHVSVLASLNYHLVSTPPPWWAMAGSEHRHRTTLIIDERCRVIKPPWRMFDRTLEQCLIVSLTCMHESRGVCISRDVGRDDLEDVRVADGSMHAFGVRTEDN